MCDSVESRASPFNKSKMNQNNSLYWRDTSQGIASAEKFETKEELDNYVERIQNFQLGQLFIAGANVYIWDGEKLIQSSGEEVDLSDYATKTGIETLTNKTLLIPEFSEIKRGDKYILVPNHDGTMALTVDVLRVQLATDAAQETADEALELAKALDENLTPYIPDIVFKAAEQTLTNKTLANAVILGGLKRYNTPGMYSLPSATTNEEHQIITADLPQTLYNKSLSEPIINSIQNTGGDTINLPDKAGTLALTSDIPTISTSSDFIKTIINLIYPEETIMLRYDDINPESLYPWQQWEKITAGKYLYTSDEAFVGTSGGSLTTDEHKLTLAEIPYHTHFIYLSTSNNSANIRHQGYYSVGSGDRKAMSFYSISGDPYSYDTKDTGHEHVVSGYTNSAGESGTHSHTFQPPYIKVVAWKRTA